MATSTPTPDEIDDRLDLAWSHPEQAEASDADITKLTEYTEVGDDQVKLDPKEFAEHDANDKEDA